MRFLFFILVLLVGTSPLAASVASAAPLHSSDSVISAAHVGNARDVSHSSPDNQGHTNHYPQGTGDHAAHCAFACTAMIANFRAVPLPTAPSNAYQPAVNTGAKELRVAPLCRPPRYLPI